MVLQEICSTSFHYGNSGISTPEGTVGVKKKCSRGQEENFSFLHLIKTVALGVLAASQSVPFPMRGGRAAFQPSWPALGLLGFSHVPFIQAQQMELGREFQVNTHVSGKQSLPDTAQLEAGGFVVVWQSEGQDGSGWGIYGQRFDSRGNPQGEEFPVNTHTAQDQGAPSTAGLTGGGFVVVWNSLDQDGSGFGVYGQLFDPVGMPVGKEFLVNTNTRLNQGSADVVATPEGGFCVVWESDKGDGSQKQVYRQQFDAQAVKVGEEVLVGDNQQRPSLARLVGGGTVVLSEGKGIFGQRYDSFGAQVGEAFQVNTKTFDYSVTPQVAPTLEGGFTAIWENIIPGSFRYDIYGQCFNASGAKVGAEFVVNTEISKNQWQPAITGPVGRGTLAVWASQGQDEVYGGVYGQELDERGRKIGQEFRANNYTANLQNYPSPQTLVGGGVVIVWVSEGQDGSQAGIFGRIFPEIAPPLTKGSTLSGMSTFFEPTSNGIGLEATPASGSRLATLEASSQTTGSHPTSATSSTGVLRTIEESTLVTVLKPHSPHGETPENEPPVVPAVAATVTIVACFLLFGGVVCWYRRRDERRSHVETHPSDTKLSTTQSEQSASPSGPSSHYRNRFSSPHADEANNVYMNVDTLLQHLPERESHYQARFPSNPPDVHDESHYVRIEDIEGGVDASNQYDDVNALNF